MAKNNPTLSIDIEIYKHYLDNSDLSEAQKTELLETLWDIVCEFAMMGFNVHPVQQAQQSCAKEVSSLLAFTQAASPTLESEKPSLVQVFNAESDAKNATPKHRQKKQLSKKGIPHAHI